jgi:hypothetical protein
VLHSDSEFCRHKMSANINASLKLVMADLAQAPGAPCSAMDLEMEYVKFENALAADQFNLTDDSAFSAKNMKEALHIWVDVFLAPWPALKWFALKIRVVEYVYAVYVYAPPVHVHFPCTWGLRTRTR